MKIIYMGTPEFAVPALEALSKTENEIVFVVSQPDSLKGRGKKLAFPPVKEKALELGLRVIQPEKVRGNVDFINEISGAEPDLIVVAAYGRILPKEILDIPKMGCVNIHGSLLPKYRGAAPIQRAIMNDEKITGNTLMYMAEGMDTGDMIAADRIEIGSMNYGELSDKMACMGAELLIQHLDSILSGTARREKQDESLATTAPMIYKDEALIDFSKGARETSCIIRGLNPNPGAYTYFNDVKMKLIEAEPSDGSTNENDGRVLEVSKAGITVACGKEKIVIKKLQMPGKRVMSVQDFLAGNKIETSDVLGGKRDG